MNLKDKAEYRIRPNGNHIVILSASDFAAFCAVAEAADSLLTHMPSEGWDQQEYGRIYEVKKVDPLLGLLNNVLDKLRRD